MAEPSSEWRSLNLVGISAPCCYEIHIFLGPVNPAEDHLVSYLEAVHEFNSVHKDEWAHFKEMKTPHLCLRFKEAGDVRVMQSAMYILNDDVDEVFTIAQQMKDHFEQRGLEVLRVKIEASLHGIRGMPETKDAIGSLYIENHIAVARKGDSVHGPMSDEEQKQLEALSDEMTAVLGRPVPLSYNLSKGTPESGYQRYLNVRHREMGKTDALAATQKIKDYVNSSPSFRVVKSIDELVVYDSYPQMDKGWIDF